MSQKTLDETIQDGYIEDYISGEVVKATPEEVNAVQVYAKMLVSDYGYKKEQIQTRPQYRVKASPSDTEYRYPVDIVVFKDDKRRRGDEFIVVECKKPTREDGIEQLKLYLKFSEAELGVWFNGENTHYIRKIIKNNRIEFDENLLNIPANGQRLEDIGKYKKGELKPTHNLKQKFVSIRNYLAGNAVGYLVPMVHDVMLALPKGTKCLIRRSTERLPRLPDGHERGIQCDAHSVWNCAGITKNPARFAPGLRNGRGFSCLRMCVSRTATFSSE